MDEKKKSRGCLIALGIVGALIVVVVVASYFFIMKAKDIVEDWAGALGASPEMIQELKTLNAQYPFQEPADGLIQEEQVARFISIKKDFADRIKSHESEFKALEKKPNKKVGFREYRQTLQLLADIRKDFIKSLRTHKMSPREYRYLTAQIYASYFGYAYRQLGFEAAEGNPLNSKQLEENAKLLDNYRDELQILNTLGIEYFGLTLADIE
ncbi:MAG: hypothetical protein ACE5HO_13175 [bacterium]